MVTGLVQTIIGVGLAFIVLIVMIQVYGNVDDSNDCNALNSTDGQTACTTAETQGWNNLSLLATLIIVPVILAIFGAFLIARRGG